MAVQLSIPFETLVSLVEQLPDDQRNALIERVQAYIDVPLLSAAEKIARLRAVQYDVTVIQEPSTRREDWYGDVR